MQQWVYYFLGSGDINNETIISIHDDVSSWSVGDRIVIASTDFSMYQAEEFDVVLCDECREREIKIRGRLIRRKHILNPDMVLLLEHITS